MRIGLLFNRQLTDCEVTLFVGPTGRFNLSNVILLRTAFKSDPTETLAPRTLADVDVPSDLRQLQSDLLE